MSLITKDLDWCYSCVDDVWINTMIEAKSKLNQKQQEK